MRAIMPLGRSTWNIFLLCSFLMAGCTSSSPVAPSQPGPGPAPAAVAIFLTPNTWDLPPAGGTLDLVIATAATESGNVAAPNVALELSASSGVLSDASPRTDTTGHARVTWTGTSSATITARAGQVVGMAAIRVPAPTPTPQTPAPTPPPGPPSPEPPAPTPGGFAMEVQPSARRADAVTPISFAVRVLTPNVPGPLAYAWDFESDGIVDSQEATPTHLFRPADHWDVRVVVTAADGRVGSGVASVVIGATPAPTVTTTLSARPTTVLMGDTVTFTATASGNTTSGSVVAYDWDFDTSTPSIDETTATGSTTTTYPTAGARTVRVTARTSNGTSGTATATVTVTAPPPPPLAVTLSVAPSPVAQGTPTTGTATVTGLDAGETIAIYQWDFDTSTAALDATTTTDTRAHTYATHGIYTATVKITTSTGRTVTSAPVKVTVTN